MEFKSKNVKSTQLKNMITKCLYFDKAMSCAELSELFDKSIPSIAKAVNELIEEGFVVEQGYAPSSGGRRPLMYAINHNAMYILAIAMDQLSTRIQLVDLLNQPVAEMTMFELKLFNNTGALATLVSQINNYIINSGIAKDKIAGIGIGMPGFINPIQGINYTHLNAGDKTLTQHISDETGLPAYIDNDSSLIALAEQKFGIAKMQKEVMVINLGWGIGLGMIVNGEIFRGRNGFAGEFSHIPLSEDGAMCDCGKRGCLEAEASMLVVSKRAIEGIQQGRITSLKQIDEAHSKLMGDAIMQAALNGDQFAVELFSDAGYKIGKALAILIHIMNPQTIVLSGRGAKVGKILMAPIQQALHKYCIPRLSGGTELLISDLGFDAELIGAAVLVMGKLRQGIKESRYQHLIIMREIDLFFLQKDEPLKSCLLFLREFILGFDQHMSEDWKYSMPFFYYKGDRICYLWIDKKTQQPYLGFTDGKRLTHPLLVSGDRSRMKIMMIDAGKDMPVDDISKVLNLALSLYRPRI